MKVKLRVVGHDVTASEIVLPLPAIIGRSSDATLTFPHPLVSRRHCELYESDGKLMVRDLGSLNGTYVGNQRVTESVVPADELLTIATVNFRVLSIDAGGDETGRPHDSTGEETTADRQRDADRRRTVPKAAPPDPRDVRDTELQSGNAQPGEPDA
jgi:pSer/pThr/pTyr-binding forkhead associated (FHA) protein